MKEKFSINQAVGFGWGVAKNKLGFFILLFLVYIAVQIVPSLLGGLLNLVHNSIFVVIVVVLLNIAAGVLRLLMGIGQIRILLNLADNKEGHISDLFSQKKLFWKYLAGSLLFGLIVCGGLMLFVIPGIIFAIAFLYYSYLIVDQNLGPIEALKQSWQITQGSRIKLLLFDLLLVLINIGGLLLLGLGLFLTIPTTMVAQAYVYRKLMGNSSLVGTPTSKLIYLSVALGVISILVIPLIVLAVNPLELTRRSRDAVRLSDMANLNNSIQTIGQVSPKLNYCNNRPSPCYGTSADLGAERTDGSGWIKVDFKRGGGSFLSKLPIDPVNKGVNVYKYCSDGVSWEITTNLESQKLVESMAQNQNGVYKVGTNLSLCK